MADSDYSLLSEQYEQSNPGTKETLRAWASKYISHLQNESNHNN